ncbi:MAG: hypothetical protein C0404_07540 [Verrucomicrobia bacterium]|nr:hypothetical protein [Verrucomicrobiota bacterium]
MITRDILKWRELLGILVSRNLKIRYKNSALGFFWSLLSPLFLIVIYAVFARILKFNAGNPDYLQFLIVGIVVWQFLVMCLNDSLGAIIGNANLIKRTSFPRIMLPLSMVLSNLVNFLLTLAVLIVYLLLVGMPMSSLLLFPLILMTHCALCLGLSLIISVVNVFYRDIEHVLGVATLGWFFLTPIFYPVYSQVDRLPQHLQWIAFLNPMTGLVCGYRTVFMSSDVPAILSMGVSALVSWVVLILGIMVFERAQASFADQM